MLTRFKIGMLLKQRIAYQFGYSESILTKKITNEAYHEDYCGAGFFQK